MTARIMFGYQIDWIRHYSDTVAQSLRGVDHLETADDYDLRQSAANLREAADKIDQIRLGKRIHLQAAE